MYHPPPPTADHRSSGGPGRKALAAIASMLSAAACWGPPEVVPEEAYRDSGAGEATVSFDHSAFDELLGAHVDAEGWVDYRALAEDPSGLDAYLADLAEAPFEELGRDGKLALLVNAYNAATLRLILDHYPLDSIKDIPADERWKGRTFTVGGNEWTLDQIENQELRAKFREPRIHFAINCASIGCPPLRTEAYVEERIEEQLESQTREIHGRERWARWDGAEGVIHLTKIYDWYRGDFEQAAGSVPEYAAAYVGALAEALAAGREPDVSWLDYAWSLNSVENRPR